MRKLFLIIVNSICICTFSQIKLNISSSMIIDEKAYPHSNPIKLFDEQAMVGSNEPPIANPVTKWGDFLDQSIYYPLSMIVDLGHSINISNIYLYDGSGVGQLDLFTGSNANWSLSFTDNFSNYNSWNKHVVNKSTRYIKVVFYTPNATFNEMVVFGDKQPIAPVFQGIIKKYPTMDEFLGVNIIHNRAPAKDISVVKHLREFHEWSWDEANQTTNYPGYPNNQYGFNPSWFDNSTNFDQVYANFKANKNTIYPTLQSSAFWFLGNPNSDSTQNKPTKPNRNPELPASYIEHADYMYQVAARYGSKTVNSANLKLRSNNSKVSGLDLLDGIEDWNEPNKNWEGRRGLFLPNEYAAMSSADYDGHEKSMGLTVGIKNADPDLKLIMGGLISLDSNYIKALKYWYDNNRTDKKFAVDVINFHNYCNDGTGQGAPATKGVSPEDFKLEEKAKAVVAYCNKVLPNHPVWVTEFGYDIQQSTSDQKAPPYGNYTAEQVQAMWNVRNYLAYAAAGIDRAYLYWLSDANSANTLKFESSGLIARINSTSTYRPSWYWIYTLRNTLKNFKFSSKPNSGNSNVSIQEYVNSILVDSLAYVLWCPTSNSTTVNNYTLTLPANSISATLINPMVGSTTGTASPLVISNNSVTLKVTEDPAYILVKKSTSTEITDNSLNKTVVEVYPNPAVNELIVNSVEQISGYEILDLKGMIVEKQSLENNNSFKISLSKFNSGMYILKLKKSNSSEIIHSKFNILK